MNRFNRGSGAVENGDSADGDAVEVLCREHLPRDLLDLDHPLLGGAQAANIIALCLNG